MTGDFYYCEFCEAVWGEDACVYFITAGPLCPVHLERVTLIPDEKVDPSIFDYLNQEVLAS